MNDFRKVIKNVSWIIVCKVIQSFIALFMSMITARYLGPSNYGLISYASSIVAFVVPIAQLGIRNILVEEIINFPEREGATLGTSLFMTIVTSIFCIIGCITFVGVVNAGEKDTLIVCALFSVSLIFQMAEMIQYWYQAKLLSKYTSILSLVAYLLVAIYKIWLLVTGKNVYWFAISYAFDSFLISFGLFVIYKRLGKQKLSISVLLAKEMLAKSKYYIISNMMVTVFSQTDKIMIKLINGNVENGYYSTAFTCACMLSFIYGAVIDSLRPVIFSSKKISQIKFEINIVLLYSIIICMGLVQGIIMTMFAYPIINVLYGNDYLGAVPVLRVLTWYLPFSYMGTIRNIWMLAEKKYQFLWKINLFGAISNVLCNYFLIPLYGAVGAAVATVITQFFTNVIMCFIVKSIRPTFKLITQSLNPKILLRIARTIRKIR